MAVTPPQNDLFRIVLSIASWVWIFVDDAEVDRLAEQWYEAEKLNYREAEKSRQRAEGVGPAWPDTNGVLYAEQARNRAVGFRARAVQARQIGDGVKQYAKSIREYNNGMKAEFEHQGIVWAGLAILGPLAAAFRGVMIIGKILKLASSLMKVYANGIKFPGLARTAPKTAKAADKTVDMGTEALEEMNVDAIQNGGYGEKSAEAGLAGAYGSRLATPVNKVLRPATEPMGKVGQAGQGAIVSAITSPAAGLGAQATVNGDPGKVADGDAWEQAYQPANMIQAGVVASTAPSVVDTGNYVGDKLTSRIAPATPQVPHSPAVAGDPDGRPPPNDTDVPAAPVDVEATPTGTDGTGTESGNATAGTGRGVVPGVGVVSGGSGVAPVVGSGGASGTSGTPSAATSSGSSGSDTQASRPSATTSAGTDAHGRPTSSASQGQAAERHGPQNADTPLDEQPADEQPDDQQPADESSDSSETSVDDDRTSHEDRDPSESSTPDAESTPLAPEPVEGAHQEDQVEDDPPAVTTSGTNSLHLLDRDRERAKTGRGRKRGARRERLRRPAPTGPIEGDTPDAPPNVERGRSTTERGSGPEPTTGAESTTPRSPVPVGPGAAAVQSVSVAVGSTVETSSRSEGRAPEHTVVTAKANGPGSTEGSGPNGPNTPSNEGPTGAGPSPGGRHYRASLGGPNPNLDAELAAAEDEHGVPVQMLADERFGDGAVSAAVDNVEVMLTNAEATTAAASAVVKARRQVEVMGPAKGLSGLLSMPDRLTRMMLRTQLKRAERALEAAREVGLGRRAFVVLTRLDGSSETLRIDNDGGTLVYRRADGAEIARPELDDVVMVEALAQDAGRSRTPLAFPGRPAGEHSSFRTADTLSPDRLAYLPPAEQHAMLARINALPAMDPDDPAVAQEFRNLAAQVHLIDGVQRCEVLDGRWVRITSDAGNTALVGVKYGRPATDGPADAVRVGDPRQEADGTFVPSFLITVAEFPETQQIDGFSDAKINAQLDTDWAMKAIGAQLTAVAVQLDALAPVVACLGSALGSYRDAIGSGPSKDPAVLIQVARALTEAEKRIGAAPDPDTLLQIAGDLEQAATRLEAEPGGLGSPAVGALRALATAVREAVPVLGVEPVLRRGFEVPVDATDRPKPKDRAHVTEIRLAEWLFDEGPTTDLGWVDRRRLALARGQFLADVITDCGLNTTAPNHAWRHDWLRSTGFGDVVQIVGRRGLPAGRGTRVPATVDDRWVTETLPKLSDAVGAEAIVWLAPGLYRVRIPGIADPLTVAVRVVGENTERTPAEPPAGVDYVLCVEDKVEARAGRLEVAGRLRRLVVAYEQAFEDAQGRPDLSPQQALRNLIKAERPAPVLTWQALGGRAGEDPDLTLDDQADVGWLLAFAAEHPRPGRLERRELHEYLYHCGLLPTSVDYERKLAALRRADSALADYVVRHNARRLPLVGRVPVLGDIPMVTRLPHRAPYNRLLREPGTEVSRAHVPVFDAGDLDPVARWLNGFCDRRNDWTFHTHGATIRAVRPDGSTISFRFRTVGGLPPRLTVLVRGENAESHEVLMPNGIDRDRGELAMVDYIIDVVDRDGSAVQGPVTPALEAVLTCRGEQIDRATGSYRRLLIRDRIEHLAELRRAGVTRDMLPAAVRPTEREWRAVERRSALVEEQGAAICDRVLNHELEPSRVPPAYGYMGGLAFDFGMQGLGNVGLGLGFGHDTALDMAMHGGALGWGLFKGIGRGLREYHTDLGIEQREQAGLGRGEGRQAEQVAREAAWVVGQIEELLGSMSLLGAPPGVGGIGPAPISNVWSVRDPDVPLDRKSYAYQLRHGLLYSALYTGDAMLFMGLAAHQWGLALIFAAAGVASMVTQPRGAQLKGAALNANRLKVDRFDLVRELSAARQLDVAMAAESYRALSARIGPVPAAAEAIDQRRVEAWISGQVDTRRPGRLMTFGQAARSMAWEYGLSTAVAFPLGWFLGGPIAGLTGQANAADPHVTAALLGGYGISNVGILATIFSGLADRQADVIDRRALQLAHHSAVWSRRQQAGEVSRLARELNTLWTPEGGLPTLPGEWLRSSVLPEPPSKILPDVWQVLLPLGVVFCSSADALAAFAAGYPVARKPLTTADAQAIVTAMANGLLRGFTGTAGSAPMDYLKARPYGEQEAQRFAERHVRRAQARQQATDHVLGEAEHPDSGSGRPLLAGPADVGANGSAVGAVPFAAKEAVAKAVFGRLGLPRRVRDKVELVVVADQNAFYHRHPRVGRIPQRRRGHFESRPDGTAELVVVADANPTRAEVEETVLHEAAHLMFAACSSNEQTEMHAAIDHMPGTPQVRQWRQEIGQWYADERAGRSDEEFHRMVNEELLARAYAKVLQEFGTVPSRLRSWLDGFLTGAFGRLCVRIGLISPARLEAAKSRRDHDLAPLYGILRTALHGLRRHQAIHPDNRDPHHGRASLAAPAEPPESDQPVTPVEGLSNDPTWYKQAVMYEVLVYAFKDSDGDGIGDFKGLEESLYHLQWLGVDCIWLPPFYPSPRNDDGYDVSDYYTVDPRYGTMEDFKRMVDAAHARGIRVVTDMVMNHTSTDHHWFKESREHPDGPYGDFYDWSDTSTTYYVAHEVHTDPADGREYFIDPATGDPVYVEAMAESGFSEMAGPDGERLFGPATIFTDSKPPSNWRWDPVRGQYFYHTFYKTQADLNYRNPAVQEEMLNVLRHWLDLGVDGFRLDAGAYLVIDPGTNGENSSGTYEYLQRVRTMIDEEYADPKRITLIEVNQPPREMVGYLRDPRTGADKCEMAFNFPLMPRLFQAIATGRRESLSATLAELSDIPDKAQWCNFLRVHDELNIGKMTQAEQDVMIKTYAREGMTLNRGINGRLAPLLGNDRQRIELANMLLFGMPGTPLIYYGDEMGMGDKPDEDDRYHQRTTFHWTPRRNAGFSTAFVAGRANWRVPFDPELNEGPEQLHSERNIRGPAPKMEKQTTRYPSEHDLAWELRVAEDQTREVPKIKQDSIVRPSVAEQILDRDSLLWWTRDMIELRKQHPVFGQGDFIEIEHDNPAVLGFVRENADETVLCVYNLDGGEQTAELDLSRWAGASLETVTANQGARIDVRGVGEQPVRLDLDPHGYVWLRVRSR